jgi:hypothetical protein
LWFGFLGLMGTVCFYSGKSVFFRRSFRTAPGLPGPVIGQPQSVVIFGFAGDAILVHSVPMVVWRLHVSLIRVLIG